MGEIVKILGVDPALRNTGLAVVCYDTEKKKFMPPQHCRILVNPLKYTGKDAILNMIDMIKETSQLEEYQNVDNVLIESPPVMFNKAWAAGVISSIAHVSGAAVALLGLEKAYLFRPSEWNKSRRKEHTHNQTQAVLGDFDTWHFPKQIKSEKHYEHIIDAASMALWWIKCNYIDEEPPPEE